MDLDELGEQMVIDAIPHVPTLVNRDGASQSLSLSVDRIEARIAIHVRPFGEHAPHHAKVLYSPTKLLSSRGRILDWEQRDPLEALVHA